MNIFNLFEAHKNPVSEIIEQIVVRHRWNRLLIWVAYIVSFCLPFLFSIEKRLSQVYTKINRKKEDKILPARKKDISVIILNWNGEAILPECITHLERALKRVPGDHEVIVVDNNSKDGSIQLLKHNFSWVKIIRLKKNIGFAKGNNEGVRVAKNDLIMLLNNDVLLSEDTFSGLLRHFGDERVFAVAPRVVLEDGSLNEGHSWGEFKDGMLRFYNERQSKELEQVDKPSLTLYPVGACAIMDKRLYRELGGLDPMFTPFYWEDDDIGYRALKRGYKIIYDPTVTVVHKNAVSSSKLSPAYIKAVREKNMLLFFWKNLTHPLYQRQYLQSLWQRINIAIEKRNYTYLIAHILAFLQIGEVMKRRITEAPWIRFSDKEVLALTRKERKHPRALNYKPHILLVTPFPPYPLNNGGAIRIYNLIKNLNSRFDFTLLSFIDSKAQVEYINEYKDLFRDIHLIERKPTPVEGLKNSELPLRYSHYLCLNMERSLRDIISNNGIDIVQVEFPWMAYYGNFVHNQPTIFVEHDVGNMFYGKGFIKPEKGFKRIFFPLKAINYEHVFIESYDKVITVTEKDQEVLKTFFPSISITTIETGVDVESFPYLYKNNLKKNLVYLGSYRHYPNEDAVVYFVNEIFPLIKEKDSDVKLYIVGSHPTRRINRLKGREDIVITGFVPDVKPYLKKGTIFIAPIRLGGGIKGKILEAMALGLPVVATPIAVTGFGARDGENISVASTSEEFAEKVVALLSDNELREKLSLNGRRFVEEKFDWKVIARRMEKIYMEFV
jgi:GT2 family glycosyltransferase/glycosyltransferase involved in cell wall biosynthesis